MEVRTTDGVAVDIPDRVWSEVAAHHPELAERKPEIVDAISHAVRIEDGPQPTRRIYFGRTEGRKWIRAIVEVERSRGVLVTAFEQGNPPARRRS